MATLEITNDVIDYDVGDLGGSQFATWCLKTGISAKSALGRKGRDFVIELPAERSRFGYDEITAKVLVNATKTGADGACIKLADVGRMASEPTPWFIVHFDLDEAGAIRKAYLAHVDEAFVSNAHEVIAGQSASALQTVQIKLIWGPADCLDPREPTELARRVRAALGASMWDYQEQKEGWNTTALMRLIDSSQSVPGTREEAFESLADLAIGLVDEVPAEASHLLDENGRDALPEGAIVKGTAIGIERRPPDPATFEVVAGGEQVVVPCQMYSSEALAPATPDQQHKIRFFTDLLSLVVVPNGMGLRVDVPAKRVSLTALGQAARVMRLITQPGARVTVRGAGIQKTLPIAGHTQHGAGDFIKAVAWERAALLGTELGLTPQTEVYPSLVLAQRAQLNALYLVMDGSRSPSQIQIGVTDKKATWTKKTSIVVVPKVALGDYGLYAVAAVIGTATLRNGTLMMNEPSIEIVSNEVRPRLELTPEFFEKAVGATIAGLKGHGFTTIVVSATKLADEDA